MNSSKTVAVAPRSVSRPDAVTEKVGVARPVEALLEERTLQVRGPGQTPIDAQATNPIRGSARATSLVGSLFPHIAGYEILEELGRGGMGVVYKAWQHSLQRPVALKMILTGALATQEDVERFRTEAMAVARLHHPHLLSIFEIGQQNGLPYYAMEYMDGGNLADHLNGQPQDPRRAAELVRTLAQAMDYAHQQGVVHRDLKPANILLSVASIPKITDFGLAKNLNHDSRLTRTGEILGTPAYMAPEQAAGKHHDVGPATDVYALGALLYELLTGQVPFRAASGAETLMQVIKEDPTPPRRRVRSIPVDLETICLKCLEKDPARRYAGAGRLADDLDRYLAGKPIEVRKTPLLQRAIKWTRRHPALAVLSAALVIVILLTFGLITSSWQQAELKAETERQTRLERTRNLVEVEGLLAGALLDRGVFLAERGDVRRGLHWMIRSLDITTKLEEMTGKPQVLDRAIRRNLSAWSAKLAAKEMKLFHKDWAWTVGFSPDGRFAVTGSRDKTVRVWDAVSGQPAGEPLNHAEPVWTHAYHPSGRFLVTGAGAQNNQNGEIRLWSCSANQPGHFQAQGAALTLPCRVDELLWSPNGERLLALVGDRVAHLFGFDAESPSPVLQQVGQPLRHQRLVRCGRFTPDGQVVVTGGQDGVIQRWEARTGFAVGEPLFVHRPVDTLDLAPDGTTVAAGYSLPPPLPNPFDPPADKGAQPTLSEVALLDLTTGRPLTRPLAHPGRLKVVRFSPDGQVLATGSFLYQAKEKRITGGEVRVWNVSARDQRVAPAPMLTHILDHPHAVWDLAFSPDGHFLLSGCEDFYARLWNLANGKQAMPALHHEGNVVRVGFHPHGGRALTASAGGATFAAARLWDLPRPQHAPRVLTQTSWVESLAWSPDGQEIYTGGKEGLVRRFDAATGAMLGEETRLPNTVLGLAWQDAEHLMCGDIHGNLVRWHPKKRQAEEVLAARGSNFNGPFALHQSRGEIVGPHRQGAALAVYDLTGKEVSPAMPYPGHCVSVAISPDGTLVASSSSLSGLEGRGRVTLCRRSDGGVLRTWDHPGVIYGLAFSPDGRLLATGGEDRLVQFWNLATGKIEGGPLMHEHAVGSIVYSPDGTLLATGCSVGTARLWDTATGKMIGHPLAHSLPVNRAVAFRPDGKMLATGSRDQSVIFWHVPEPMTDPVGRLRLWVEVLSGMHMSAQEVILPLTQEELQAKRCELQEQGGWPRP